MTSPHVPHVKPRHSVQRDYWFECVQIAAEECGATLTDEQLDYIAGSVRGGHENYGTAFYSPSAGEHLSAENDRLRRELRSERDKVPCSAYSGRGTITTLGPYHCGTSRCDRCDGEGRHAP